MKKRNIFYKLFVIVLCFSCIQIQQVNALSSDVSYVAGRFAWDIAEALKAQKDYIDVPAEVYRNDLVMSCWDAALDAYPEGEAIVRSLKYSGITKTLNFEYYDKTTMIFKASNEQEFVEIIYYMMIRNIKSFMILSSFPADNNWTSNELVQYIFDSGGQVITIPTKHFVKAMYFTNITGNMTEDDKLTINSFISASTKNIKQNASVREKVEQVNAILTKNFEYDDSLVDNSHYASYMIQTGRGVCSAYAYLGYKMLRAVGVPTRIITGNSVSDMNVAHAWLLVRAEDGNWYHFDPTWNDGISQVYGGVSNEYTMMSYSKAKSLYVFDENKFSNTENDAMYEYLNHVYVPTVTLGINDSNMMVNELMLKVDPNPNVTPVIINDSTYLPVRVLVEIFDGSIVYDSITQKIHIIIGKDDIEIQINSIYANLNGRPVTLIAPPTIVEGRTLLPLRSIMELLGKTVIWNDETRIVTIS